MRRVSRNPLRQLARIMLIYDPHMTALFLGGFTLLLGLVILFDVAERSTLLNAIPTDALAIAMIIAGCAKILGLATGWYRVHLAGAFLAFICWSFLAVVVWQLAGRTLTTFVYAYMAAHSAWMGLRLYWDHERLSARGLWDATT